MAPLVAFAIVFAILLVALIKFKVTPSVGLFAAAILFGIMVGMPIADILSKLPAGFGNMMTSIGLLIVFGSIFGDILGESGATEELAKGMVRLFGKKNDLLALNLVGFILSIPIYFGCAYIMTAPLVNALQKISKKSMKGYVIAIFTGLMLTHSCVAPTPGPLAVAGQVGANVGWFIIWGIVVCLPASLLVGWLYANLVVSKEARKEARAAMKEIVEDDELLAPDPNKPSALTAFLLVIFPIALIVFASVFALFTTEGPLYTFISFVGNSNVALFIAMLLKSVYEIALSYGYSYETEEEKVFILKLIQIAMLDGPDYLQANAEFNELIDQIVEDGDSLEGYRVDKVAQMKATAESLSTEMLYTKFLQGQMIVGIAGGIFDPIYINRISDYAVLKYRRRFLRKKMP